jgi:hypothetical protein
VSLGLSGAVVLVSELEARHHVAQTAGGRIAAEVFIWFVLAGAIRVVILIAQGAGRLAGRHETPIAPEQ